MRSQMDESALERVVAFHGHLCPGLMTGVRVAEIALRELGPRSSDEEIVAVVETDNCSVDALQYMLGTTFGKGNLLHLDHGQNVFTLARRSDGKAIRVTAKPRPKRDLSPEQEAIVAKGRSPEASPGDLQALDALWRQRALAVLDVAEEALFDVEQLDGYAIPDKASLYPSLKCDGCGRMTMASRMQTLGDQNLCVSCHTAATQWDEIVLRPIGRVHNDLIAGQAPPRARSQSSRIEVRPEYAQGLIGLADQERLQVIFAFDRAPEPTSLLQHPQGEETREKRGVFGLRSPQRPNPIGMTAVRLLRIEGPNLWVSGLDAWNGSPILDIKPYIAD